MVTAPDIPGRFRTTGCQPEPKLIVSSASTRATAASAPASSSGSTAHGPVPASGRSSAPSSASSRA